MLILPTLYLRRSDCNSDTNIKPLKNKELMDPTGWHFANSRFFRESLTVLR